MIKPPIEIRYLNQTDERRLSDSFDTFQIPIKDMINITVVSEFYEDDSEEV